MFLAFMSLSNGALTVFWYAATTPLPRETANLPARWFVDLTACGVLISWISILINHQRLVMAMRKQNIPLSALPWHSGWTTYSTPVALFLCVVILLTGGYTVFTKGNWSVSGFVSSYLDIPLVLVAFGLWKLFKRTKFVKLSEIPLREALDDYLEHPEDKDPAKKGWRKYVGFLWD
jgi:yeast amino acid transporter